MKHLGFVCVVKKETQLLHIAALLTQKGNATLLQFRQHLRTPPARRQTQSRNKLLILFFFHHLSDNVCNYTTTYDPYVETEVAIALQIRT